MNNISINITIIIGIILIIAGIKVGFKVGLTKGISHLLALIVTVLTLFLILLLRVSVHAVNIKTSVMSVIMLVILGTVYGVMKLLLKSAHSVSKLPVLHQMDQVLGIFVGLIWFAIIYMVMIALSCRGYFGAFGQIVASDVEKSELLTLINKFNILMPR